MKKRILEKAQRARKAALALATLSAARKKRALMAMARAVRKNNQAILKANNVDMAKAKKNRLSAAMLDRLKLDRQRIEKMARVIEQVAQLKDPVGRILHTAKRPGGLVLQKVRVPIGVVAVIYEARPNVTADAAALCLKSGNAVILKGGSEALHSNRAIVKVLAGAAGKAGMPDGAIGFIDTADRAAVRALLTLDKYVDVVIPRGGESLIRAVARQATMPVIKHYKGVCHVYVDNQADLGMAERIVVNAKVQRPGVCNAMETLLVSNRLPKAFLRRLLVKLGEQGVEIRGDARVRRLYAKTVPAAAGDWGTEYLDLILAVKPVSSLDEAIDHINTYGSKHTDAIVTRNPRKAKQFVARVDSSSVMVNASTRLSDGGVYGLGAEVGISTDKIGARGPMGVEDLTTYKWVVRGKGTIRE